MRIGRTVDHLRVGAWAMCVSQRCGGVINLAAGRPADARLGECVGVGGVRCVCRDINITGCGLSIGVAHGGDFPFRAASTLSMHLSSSRFDLMPDMRYYGAEKSKCWAQEGAPGSNLCAPASLVGRPAGVDTAGTPRSSVERLVF